MKQGPAGSGGTSALNLSLPKNLGLGSRGSVGFAIGQRSKEAPADQNFSRCGRNRNVLNHRRRGGGGVRPN